MTNLAMWSLIVGALTPPLVAIIQQPRWAGWVRSTVMIAAAAVDGVGVAYFQGDFTGKRLLDAALVAGVAIIAAYHGIWKPSGIAPKIENATIATSTPAA